MAAYRFPLSDRAHAPEALPGLGRLPAKLPVMCAGEHVCIAELQGNAYVCNLSAEYDQKLRSGKLEPIFVYEPPFIETNLSDDVARELISILLVGASRKGTDLNSPD